MAQPLTIPIVRDPDIDPADTVEVQVDGNTQNDRVNLWPNLRHDPGFGFDPIGTGYFGLSTAGSQGFGAGPFGLGYFGYPILITDHDTIASFVAGDYTVKLRSRDGVGNVSNWSAGATIEHRPIPPAPEDLAVDAGVLSWTWSDP